MAYFVCYHQGRSKAVAREAVASSARFYGAPKLKNCDLKLGAVHKWRPHFYQFFWPPPPHPSHSVTHMTTPLEKDDPYSFTPPPLFFLIQPQLQSLGTKHYVTIEWILENLAPTCGRPTGLDTPSPYCHTLSHIPLPPPPLTADVVYGRPLNVISNTFFQNLTFQLCIYDLCWEPVKKYASKLL